MDNPYDRLAPFIQEYLYQQGWASLRPIQVEACQVIFATDAHLLVAAGTASGKTEAAFLPVLSVLHDQPSQTVGAIYISPIKALINDQFDRLTSLLKAADIPVWAWHGDVVQSRKKQLIANPKGILQITPESLESLLINKYSEIARLFGELRFVIIDEIHAFMGVDRGSQILCQLSRLARLTGNQPRRIGLSATLGDYKLAEDWLRAGTDRPVITPTVPGSQRKLHLAMEHFYDSGAVVRARGDTRDEAFPPHTRYLFQQSQVPKCLIFANGRTETERAIAALREMATAKGLPDHYHVHHGSISASLREAAENAMRNPNQAAVTAATVTFEMGIDLGQLDRVIQLEAPASVASFLQRLGRSGRRGSAADMRFVYVENQPIGDEWLPEQLPWQLLQGIAILQLYLEEKWIEPIHPVRYPLSLLYQQTLSALSVGELSPPALAQQILTLPPFQGITQEDFRLFLRHLIELGHLQKTPEGGIILGLKAEPIVRDFKFYAVFPDIEEYSVRYQGIELGGIVVPPDTGERLSLAGRTWEVVEVNSRQKTINVQPAIGVASSVWRGSSGTVHSRILQRMRQVLLESVEYPYLQRGARERLRAARALAEKEGLGNAILIPQEDNYCCILPWVGTVAFRTLERFLRLHCKESLKLKGIRGRSPYFLMVQLGKASAESLDYEIRSLGDRRLSPEELLAEDEAPKLQKYDDFIPPELLRKAFATDHLDLEELGRLLKGDRSP